MSDVTVNELENLVAKCFELREEYDKKKEEASEAWSKVEELQNRIVSILDSMEMDTYKAKAGTFSYKLEESYKVPKDIEARERFFNYLKERGVYETIITVNSRTLNAFAKAECEASSELDFNIPGIEKTTPAPRVTMRKAK